MKKIEDLRSNLRRLDGRGYKAYKDIKSVYQDKNYQLLIDHVQGDPFAQPSRIRVRVLQNDASFPGDTYEKNIREIALRDYLTRQFHKAVKKISMGNRGSGKSGIIEIDRPGQEILERTSMFVTEKYVEARFLIGLPAFGRKIAGKHAEEIFFSELPEIVNSSLFYNNLDSGELYRHIETAEDADFLRERLKGQELTCFVADGSILPRKSGIDQRPLSKGNIVPFTAPDPFKTNFTLPNKGEITGMGIPEGITLIVGGGYHGKSTLLNALELGVYNHIPGDGREFVVTDSNAIKIRAEDGRRIEKTCISPFINNLPFNQETDSFSSEDASGSTSQSANIIESIEAGAEVLLIDEDTSATNFMIRDHRMQELVAKEKEPITPFIDKVRQLYTSSGISTILVIGGSGDYFDIADNTICMIEYKPVDVSSEAKAIAEKYKSERTKEGGKEFGRLIERVPLAKSFDPRKGHRDIKITSDGLNSIMYGKYRIDLSAVDQIIDSSQTRAIGDAIQYSTKFMNGENTLKEIIDIILNEIAEKSMDVLSPWPVGNYAMFRGLELASAINRLRTLEVEQRG